MIDNAFSVSQIIPSFVCLNTIERGMRAKINYSSFMNFTRGVCKFLHLQIEQDFQHPVGRTANKSFSSNNSLYKKKLFCVQNNVIVIAENNAVCTQLKSSSAILKQEFSPYPR